ncbi:hypothetical protein [Streptomyces sp. SLBN-134]|uniref:hypothetical protein n=1 Tax=Streptomyces sp. SLBN-134 TaxID=2768456 RepID=UPI0011509161|nr:hypothetical protein [Streptomyces sp. SLBN-134]TQL20170.1 hypothetical protein FBY37_2121 [Streptomyces sp. SLBN-134]
MANVNIYPAHKDILDSLVTSGKAKSTAASTKTGPFKEMRDAYVFAASLAMALNQPTPTEKMPTSKKDVLPIQDRVFLGAEGATEITAAVALTSAAPDQAIEESLRSQLDLLASEKIVEQLALLDRYAHAGFEWLVDHWRDESSVRDLVMSAIDTVECAKREVGDESAVQDPLLGLLGVMIK